MFPSYFIETEMNLIKVEQQFDGLQFNFNNEPPDFTLYWSILLKGLSLIVKYSFKTYCTSKPSWLDVNLSKYNEESIPQ